MKKILNGILAIGILLSVTPGVFAETELENIMEYETNIDFSDDIIEANNDELIKYELFDMQIEGKVSVFGYYYDKVEKPDGSIVMYNYYLDKGIKQYESVIELPLGISIEEYKKGNWGKGASIFYVNGNSMNSLKVIMAVNKTFDKVNRNYEYYGNPTYGQHGNKIQFIFHINNDVIKHAERRIENTSTIDRYYEYYPDTFYRRNHASHIKTIFNVDEKGNVMTAEGRKDNEFFATTIYEYYPNAKYGQHGNKIKYFFYIDANKNLSGAAKRNENSRDISAYYEYYPNTKFGSHGNRIKRVIHVKNDKTIKYSEEKSDNSSSIISYHYYGNTTKYDPEGEYVKKANEYLTTDGKGNLLEYYVYNFGALKPGWKHRGTFKPNTKFEANGNHFHKLV